MLQGRDGTCVWGDASPTQMPCGERMGGGGGGGRRIYSCQTHLAAANLPMAKSRSEHLGTGGARGPAAASQHRSATASRLAGRYTTFRLETKCDTRAEPNDATSRTRGAGTTAPHRLAPAATALLHSHIACRGPTSHVSPKQWTTNCKRQTAKQGAHRLRNLLALVLIAPSASGWYRLRSARRHIDRAWCSEVLLFWRRRRALREGRAHRQ